MGFFVRKIYPAAWESSLVAEGGAVSGDVMNCIATNNDALSVWYAENEQEIDKAILALISGIPHPDQAYLFVFDESELQSRGFETIKTDGETAAVPLKALHRDIVGLNAERLVELAEMFRVIMQADDDKVKTFDSKEVISIVAEGVRLGSVDIYQIKENFLAGVAKKLGVVPVIEACTECKLPKNKRKNIAAYKAAIAEKYIVTVPQL